MSPFPSEPTILLENQDLLALDKPSGLSVLADRVAAESATDLWNWLLQRHKSAKKPAPLLVHRIDKATSGLLLIAQTRRAQRSLTRQFTEHRALKSYLAWVVGGPPAEIHAGRIDLPLCPGRKGRFRVAGPRASIVMTRRGVARADWRLAPDAPPPPGEKSAHPSQTDFRVLRRESGRTLLLLKPRTGRTHQLRVHLSWVGWPIVHDPLYGPANSGGAGAPPAGKGLAIPRMLLHARALTFTDDWTAAGKSRRVRIRAPIPADFPGARS